MFAPSRASLKTRTPVPSNLRVCSGALSNGSSVSSNARRVGAVRNRCAGHYPDRRSRCNLPGILVPCGDLADNAEVDWRSRGCTRRVCGPNGVAVHRRVVERRYVESGRDVLVQHLAECLHQWFVLWWEDVDVAQDTGERFFDANHRLRTYGETSAAGASGNSSDGDVAGRVSPGGQPGTWWSVARPPPAGCRQ